MRNDGREATMRDLDNLTEGIREVAEQVTRDTQICGSVGGWVSKSGSLQEDEGCTCTNLAVTLRPI